MSQCILQALQFSYTAVCGVATSISNQFTMTSSVYNGTFFLCRSFWSGSGYCTAAWTLILEKVCKLIEAGTKWLPFRNDIFKCIFLNENVWISIYISLKFVPSGWVDDIPALVGIMAWCWKGDKPLSEPVTVSLLMHICVTRPQWVKPYQSLTPLLTGSLLKIGSFRRGENRQFQKGLIVSGLWHLMTAGLEGYWGQSSRLDASKW